MGKVYYDEDMVDLLVDVQDAFGFTLTEADPLPITTVGQLYFVVLEKLGSPPSHGCVSSAAFYRFRRALLAACDVSRDDVRLQRPLDELVPRAERGARWQHLQTALGVSLPPLCRPGKLVVLLAVSWLALFLGSVVAADRLGYTWVALLLALPLYVAAARKLTAPLAIELPSQCVTVGDTVRTLAQSQYRAIAEQTGRWHEQEIWVTLRAIVARHAGTRPSDVYASTRFSKDLHLA